MRYYWLFCSVLLAHCSRSAVAVNVAAVSFGAGNVFTLGAVETQLTRPLPPATVQAVHGINFAQLYDALLATTTDNAFVLDGATISNVHSQLVAAAPLFQGLQTRYSSIGAHALVSAVALGTAPSGADIGTEFAQLARDFSSGYEANGIALVSSPSIHKFVATPSSADDSPLDPDHKIKLAPQPEAVRNLAAIAAMAVAQNSYASGLGLVSNGLSGSDCSNYNSVAAVYFTRAGQTGKNICTGTFISHDANYDYMLTAAHCVNNQASGFSVMGANGPASSVGGSYETAFGSSSEINDSGDAKNKYDDGILKFPVGTAAGYSPLASQSPAVGDLLNTAGYGHSSLGGDGETGTLRCGSNQAQASSAEQGMIQLSGIESTSSDSVAAGQQVMAAPGDSGSAIFNQAGQVVGVNSNTADDPNTSQYTNVNSTSNCAFIAQYSNSGDPTQCPTGVTGSIGSTGRGGSSPSQSVRTANTQQESQPKTQSTDFPTCTNGSDTGSGYGWQPELNGPNGGSCRVPNS